MCRNGQYTERGIKQIDGFMSERWRIEPGFYTKMDPSLGLQAVLLEPTTVVAKAWELVSVMRARAFWVPHQVLITGAGPIGMLAAMIAVQHDLDVHVLDRVTEGAKPNSCTTSAPPTTPGRSPTSASTPMSSSSAPASAR